MDPQITEEDYKKFEVSAGESTDGIELTVTNVNGSESKMILIFSEEKTVAFTYEFFRATARDGGFISGLKFVDEDPAVFIGGRFTMDCFGGALGFEITKVVPMTEMVTAKLVYEDWKQE